MNDVNTSTQFFVAMDEWTDATLRVLGQGDDLVAGNQSAEVKHTEIVRTLDRSTWMRGSS